MPATLTEIERKILDFMVQYLRENTYQPSIREIGERFGIKSTKTVSEHLQALAQKGFLERDPSRSRGVRILGVDLHADTVSVPCFDTLPDGRGRRERAETFLTVDRRLAGAKGGFFVRAKGDDAALLGVQEGDFLLLEPVEPGELEDGAVVVARVDGESAAFHRFARTGSSATLQELRLSKAGEEPRVIEEPSELDVVGRLAALYRRMDGESALMSLTAH